MTDTKFPDIQNSEYYMEIPARFDFFADFYGSDMESWFQRCIEDIPQIEMKGHTAWYPTHNQWLEWKEKWFGQFKEESL